MLLATTSERQGRVIERNGSDELAFMKGEIAFALGNAPSGGLLVLVGRDEPHATFG